MGTSINLTSIFVTNILGLILLCVAIAGNQWRLNARGKQAFALKVIAVLIIVSCVVDPIVFMCDGVQGALQFAIVFGGNTWLFFANLILGPCWVLFVSSYLGWKVPRPAFVVLAAVEAVALALLVVNFFVPVIYSVSDQSVYERGPAFWVCTVIEMMFLLSAALVYLGSRRNGGARRNFPVVALVAPVLVGAITQTLYYGVSVVWPCISISFAGVMLCLQNDVITRDSLTGLHNRTAFWDLAEKMIAEEPDREYAVIISDIENFKSINARQGMDKGDELLKFIGTWLAALNTRDALFARYSTDRFVGIVRMPEAPAAAAEDGADGGSYDQGMMDAFLNDSLEKLYADAPVDNFRAKFGLYEHVDKSLPVSVMCDRAFLAVSGIKRVYDCSVAHYTPEMAQRQAREVQISESMETALNEGRFSVYYQPKHDAKTGEVAGAEALVRWQNPDLGFMRPDEFLPIFEDSGFIVKLDAYVLHTVCADLAAWIDAGGKPIPVSVNTSRKDYYHEGFIDDIASTVSGAGVDPGLIHVEITESACVDQSPAFVERIEAVRALGIKVELDDFGSGYSSLGTLATLPVDIIKLDMAFMRDFDKQRPVVASIIELAHNLGFTLVAEGVETPDQLEGLRGMDCDLIQGYCYSKPLPKDDFEAYLKQCGL